MIVRILFIFMEFGSRPLKNAKKILSCGFICLWLYHYRFGSSVFSFTSRMSKMKMVDGNVAAENATFVVFFLLLRLALKLAELLNLFKTWKRLRIVKLLKLAKFNPSSRDLLTAPAMSTALGSSVKRAARAIVEAERSDCQSGGGSWAAGSCSAGQKERTMKTDRKSRNQKAKRSEWAGGMHARRQKKKEKKN